MTNSEYEPKSEEAKDAYNYFKHRKDSFDGKKIREWINSKDIELLSVLYDYFFDKEIYLKIDPPLTFVDFYNFVIKYYSMCFEKDLDSYWILSRYSAGRDLVNLFKSFWKDPEVPRKYLTAMKKEEW